VTGPPPGTRPKRGVDSPDATGGSEGGGCDADSDWAAGASGFFVRVIFFLGAGTAAGSGIVVSGATADLLTEVVFLAAIFFTAVFLAVRLAAGGVSWPPSVIINGRVSSLIFLLIRNQVKIVWGEYDWRLKNRVGPKCYQGLQSW